MIPLTLTIQGLYSYQETVTIDFRRLTAAQLFGIFGPVGSGKSSILEAMTLALYGESARLNKGDKRSTNMLNLRSDRLFVDFTFLDRQSRRFRFTAEAKRNGKRPEEVGSMSRRAYRSAADADAADAAAAASGEWIPLDHVDGERVLGLSYQNFRRTTIIPQGRFQEFLQLGATERTDMMKDLFQLERFDLHSRTRTLMGTTSTRLEGVESALRELPEDPEAIRRELEAERTRVTAERTAAGTRLRDARARAEELERLRTLHRELQELRKQDSELRHAEHSLKELENHIARLHDVRDHLRAPFDRLREARRREEDAQARVAEVAAQQEPAQQRLREIEERRRRLEDEATRRPVLEALRDTLSRGAQRVSVEGELHQTRQARDAAVAHRDDANRQIAEFREAIAELERDVPERSRLRELHAAIQAEQYYRSAVSSIAERRRTALRAAGVDEELQGTAPPDRESVPADEVARLRNQAENDRRRLQTQLHHAAVDDQLRSLAESLAEGEPCPVCGSVHHPGMERESVPPDPTALEEELRAVETRISQLAQLQGTLTGLAGEEQSLERPPEVAGRDALPADPAAAVEWLEEVEARYTRIDARRSTLEELQTTRGYADTAVATEEARVEERLRRREELAREETSFLDQLDEDARAHYETVLGAAALPAGSAPAAHRSDGEAAVPDADTVVAAAEQISRELSRLQSEREGIAEKHSTAAQEVQRLTAQAEERGRVFAAAGEERRAAEHALSSALAAAPHIPDGTEEHQIEDLLNDLPDLAGHEERLATARERKRRITERTAEITEELDAAPADTPSDPATVEAELSRVQGDVEQLEQTITALGERLGAVNSQIETAFAQIDRRVQLTAERTALQTRRDNLTTLINLFRGAGFVSYVAQVYLEQLVAAANQRFRYLTRNQLELVLSGDRDFAVIDHLNGGRRRSVKTLSGGQTFQAALCLALALVDSIDHGAGGDQPAFFFLDEGFGALDGDSLHDVFETLKNLRRENRVIGIISHVEALQQEIDTSLMIHLDEDRGSVVSER
ncbi:MAG: SMC family ATPase [Alkalispirochaeta sp.]